MNFNWKEMLKKISMVAGKLLFALGILYIFALIVLSLLYRPMGVKVTNVTSSSATVTWYTSVPMTGVVKYKEKESFLPWIFGGLGSQKAYDDRDYANAQTVCVEKFNEKIEKEVDSEFTVSGEDFDCENIKIKKVGRYYVHHVTVKGLKESSPYYFRVGDRLWSWKGDTATFKTYETPTSVKEPVPVFGRIVSSEGNYSSDSIIFTTFKNSKGETSIEYSSVSNSEGGWYIDGGNLRSATGEIMEVTPSEDSFTAYGRYKASGNSESVNWVFGSFDGAYPDLEVKYTERDNWLYKFVFGVNACDPLVNGWGNCAKEKARSNGGVLDEKVLKEMGLCNNAVACAGNLSAITGNGITAGSLDQDNPQVSVKLDKKKAGDSEWEEWGQPQVGPSTVTPSGGTGSQGNSTGEISVVVTKNQGGEDVVQVKIGGTNLSNYDFMQEKIDELAKGGCVPTQGTTEGSSHSCTFNVKAVEVDILRMISDNPDFTQSCKNDPSCPSEAIVGALKQKKVNAEEILRVENELGTYKLPEAYVPCSQDINNCMVTLPEGLSLNPSEMSIIGDISPQELPGNLNGLIKALRLLENLEERKKMVMLLANQLGIDTGSSSEGNANINLLLSPSTSFVLGPGNTLQLSNTDGLSLPTVNSTPTLTVPNIVIPSVESSYIIDRKVGNSALVEGVNDDLLDIALEKGNNRKKEKIRFLIRGSKCSDGKCTVNEAKDLLEKLSLEGVEGVYVVDAPGYTSAKFVVPNPIPAGLDSSYIGNLEGIIDELQITPILPRSPIQRGVDTLTKLVEGTIGFAYASNTVSEGYVLFLPEYGMFSMQLGEFELTTEVANDKTIYIFYMESNGKKGFQAPKDPDNPTVKEDIVIRSNSFKINIEKKSTQRKYSLKKGVNIVSFDFVPASKKGDTYSARNIIENAESSGLRVEYISYFDGGRWVEGLKCSLDGCVGGDFTILPGKGYLLKTTTGGDLTVPAYNLKSAIPLNLSAGWNLIGVHGYNKAYTAKTLINSINKVDGLTADNVSWYPTSKGRYEGLQVTEGSEYGFDYPINPMNGYFVRIKGFVPEDESCRSIIWHEGNELHGKCGDSKSLF